MTIVYLIILSCISACLYRLGGCGPADLEKEWGWLPRWVSAFPKKRDLGCGLLVIAGCFIVGLQAPWWTYVLAVGLMWASLSTYWDFMFGYDNHWFHGFMIGLSMFPIAIYDEPLALGIRCLALAVLMGGYSALEGNATREELGRGFVMPITLGLLIWL